MNENCKAGDKGHPGVHNQIAVILNAISKFSSWVTNFTNGESVLNLYPPSDGARTKIFFWSKPSGTVDNQRMVSIEAHGLNDKYHEALEYPLCHVTFYSTDDTGTQNKVIEWQWGESWINALHIYPDLHVDGKLRVATPETIPYSNSGGFKGDIRWDNDYLYVCIENNVWKRMPLASW